MRQAFFDGAVNHAQVIVPDFGTIEGLFQISSLEFTGEHNGEVTFDLALESARADSPPGNALREMAVKSRLRVVHENRDVHPVCDCELGEKTRDVRLDGGLAHEQGCRDLGVGCAGPHRSRDLPLPVCERRQALGSEATAICQYVVAEVREKCAGDRR